MHHNVTAECPWPIHYIYWVPCQFLARTCRFTTILPTNWMMGMPQAPLGTRWCAKLGHIKKFPQKKCTITSEKAALKAGNTSTVQPRVRRQISSLPLSFWNLRFQENVTHEKNVLWFYMHVPTHSLFQLMSCDSFAVCVKSGMENTKILWVAWIWQRWRNLEYHVSLF